jgi:hypothetical protein
MATAKIPDRRVKYMAIAGILISWATFWMFLFAPFGFIAWLGILIYLIVKKSKLISYFILSAWLFVPGCSILSGTIRYFNGAASVKSVGGPEMYHGIDSETRVPSVSSGCIVVGYEPFVFEANNAAVRTCTKLFGFQRGSYTGVFPSKDEAKDIMQTADTVRVLQAEKYFQFITDNQTVELETTDFLKFRYSPVTIQRVKGRIINDECFLFQSIDQDDPDDKPPIYLVDIKEKRLLTRYLLYY